MNRQRHRQSGGRAGPGDGLGALAKAIGERRAILFVGAGVSATLGLPSWRELIERMGEALGFDSGGFLELSTDFRALTEYYKLERGDVDTLCDWMRSEWTVDDETLMRSEVHRLIVEMGFRVIYTTNYDHLLERAFELHRQPFNKIVGAEDIAREDASLPTLVKFHGDVDDHESVVITETDYFRRLAFEEPLDIKLTADAFGRTVLFIGYSLSDINLRFMLYRMRGIWLDSGYERLQPRSYIYMTRPNPVQERILDSWGIAPVIGEGEDEGAALLGFLRALASAVAAKQ